MRIPIAKFTSTLCKFYIYSSPILYILYHSFWENSNFVCISGLLVRPALPLTFYYTINSPKIQIFWRISPAFQLLKFDSLIPAPAFQLSCAQNLTGSSDAIPMWCAHHKIWHAIKFARWFTIIILCKLWLCDGLVD